MAVPQKPRNKSSQLLGAWPEDLRDYLQAIPTRETVSRCCPSSDRFEATTGLSWPYAGRPCRHDLSTWLVTDDWPRPVPVTTVEVDVFEAWFGDIFDEIFGPCE
jgi:hypothetical protein